MESDDCLNTMVSKHVATQRLEKHSFQYLLPKQAPHRAGLLTKGKREKVVSTLLSGNITPPKTPHAALDYIIKGR